jgi:hypothetical protein
MRLFWLILALLVAALGGSLLLLRAALAAPAQATPVLIDTGDAVQVSGAPIACRVITPAGVKSLDCRVGGQLAGTYGALMSAKRLQVVRFRNAHVAKVVFVATQRGGFRTCR